MNKDIVGSPCVAKCENSKLILVDQDGFVSVPKVQRKKSRAFFFERFGCDILFHSLQSNKNSNEKLYYVFKVSSRFNSKFC